MKQFNDCLARIKQGGHKSGDLMHSSKVVFSTQLGLSDFPIKDFDHTFFKQLFARREAINNGLGQAIEELKGIAKRGDVQANVLLGQFYYDAPIEQLAAYEGLFQDGDVARPPWWPDFAGVDEIDYNKLDQSQKNEAYEEAHDEALKYFQSAWQQHNSVLAMYYIAKLWMEVSPVELVWEQGNKRLTISDLKSDFERLWDNGELTKKKCDLSHKDVLLIKSTIMQACLMKEIRDKIRANEELEEIQLRLQDTIRDTNHSVKNTLQPFIIDSVIKSIRHDSKNRGDVLTLYRVYQAEHRVLELNKLMEIKLNGVNDLRTAIQNSTSSRGGKQCVGVGGIIDLVFSRLLNETLSRESYNFSDLQNELVQKTGHTVDELKESYDDAIVASFSTSQRPELTAWAWFNETVSTLSLQVHPVWDSLHIIRGSTLETLLFKWFNELILNALRYHAHGSVPLLEIVLGEEDREQKFLMISVSNSTGNEDAHFGSRMGLKLLESELNQINDCTDSLAIDRSDTLFTTHLLLKKSLLFGE